jgi:hypothetical protein
MSDLATLADLPDVRSVVLGDLAGSFLDAVREPDGEAIAAVMGFVASALAEAGEELGLGPLRRITAAGDARGCVVAVQGSQVVTARVEPGKAVAAVERVLDGPPRGRV